MGKLKPIPFPPKRELLKGGVTIDSAFREIFFGVFEPVKNEKLFMDDPEYLDVEKEVERIKMFLDVVLEDREEYDTQKIFEIIDGFYLYREMNAFKFGFEFALRLFLDSFEFN